MARSKRGYQGDFSKLDTRAGARQTSQESIDAARTRAAGAPAPSLDPGFQTWAKGEIEDRAQRTVRGRYEHKGRAPMYTLSSPQFTEFQETGGWSGEPRMPTPEEYGPQSAAPEDKEYETGF